MPGAAGGQGRPANNNVRGNPLGAYGNIDKPGGAPGGGRGAAEGGGNGRRNYNKPWLPPKQEQKDKKEAKTFAESLYGEGGVGPDSDLIN